MVGQKRDAAFDVVRFVAMFMVVYWHVMSYRPGFDLETMPSYAANFIIAVNMPLFFIVSGYFSRRLHESGDWRRLANRLIGYFWPIAFFAVFFSALECFVWHKYAVSVLPLQSFKKFLFGNWFFFTLAACDVFAFLAFRAKRSLLAVVCALAFAVCLCSSGRIWYASSAVAMFPFYLFGLFALPSLLSCPRMFALTACFGGGAMIISTFLSGNIATNGLAFYWDRFDVWHPQFDKVLHMVLRFIVGSFGSLFIIGVVKLCLHALPRLSVLAVLGTETLGIYLLQGWLIRGVSNPFVSLDTAVWQLLVSSIAVFTIAFCIVKALKWNRRVCDTVFGAWVVKKM